MSVAVSDESSVGCFERYYSRSRSAPIVALVDSGWHSPRSVDQGSALDLLLTTGFLRRQRVDDRSSPPSSRDIASLSFEPDRGPEVVALVPLGEWAHVFLNATPYSAVLTNTHCVVVYSCRSEVQDIHRRTCSGYVSLSELLVQPAVRLCKSWRWGYVFEPAILRKVSRNSCESNCGPLSENSMSCIPWRQNTFFSLTVVSDVSTIFVTMQISTSRE